MRSSTPTNIPCSPSFVVTMCSTRSPYHLSPRSESLGEERDSEIPLQSSSPSAPARNGQTIEPEFLVTINEPTGTSSLLPVPIPCPRDSFDFWAYSTPQEKLSYIYTSDDFQAIQTQLDRRIREFGSYDAVAPKSVQDVLLSVIDEEEWMTRARYDNPQGMLRCKSRNFERTLKREREGILSRIQTNLSETGRPWPVYLSERNELLAYVRCGACGFKGHPAGGLICPIGNVHSVCRVLTSEIPATFFRFFPCNYCGGKFHSLVVCPQLHALCRRCCDRGHTAQSELCLDHSDGARGTRQRRFDFYKPYGLLTKSLPLYYGFQAPFIDPALWENINANCAEKAKNIDVVVDFYDKW